LSNSTSSLFDDHDDPPNPWSVSHESPFALFLSFQAKILLLLASNWCLALFEGAQRTERGGLLGTDRQLPADASPSPPALESNQVPTLGPPSAHFLSPLLKRLGYRRAS